MIAYKSRTGNVRNIVGRLDSSIPTIELTESSVINEPYFLFTYTDGLGEIPPVVKDFLLSHEENRKNIKGIISSGNTNFGNEYFCGCANEISKWLNIPIIRKIDLRGNQDDITAINNSYKKIIAGEE